MASSWAYIYIAEGTDCTDDRVHLERAGVRTTLVPVVDVDAAVRVAKSLVKEGVQSIELCGYFGAVGSARVLEAVAGRAAVGFVSFPAESVFAAAAAFAQPDHT